MSEFSLVLCIASLAAISDWIAHVEMSGRQ